MKTGWHGCSTNGNLRGKVISFRRLRKKINLLLRPFSSSSLFFFSRVFLCLSRYEEEERGKNWSWPWCGANLGTEGEEADTTVTHLSFPSSNYESDSPCFPQSEFPFPPPLPPFPRKLTLMLRKGKSLVANINKMHEKNCFPWPCSWK